MLHPYCRALAALASEALIAPTISASPASRTGFARPRPAACGTPVPAFDVAASQTQVRTPTNGARVDDPIAVSRLAQRFDLGTATFIVDCVTDGALERRFYVTAKDSEGGPAALVTATIPPEGVDPWQPDADGALTLLLNTLQLDGHEEEAR